MDGKQPACPQVENLQTRVHSTENALREYIRLYVKVPLVARLGVLAQTLDFVADAAPGVKEILAIGQLCHEVRANNFDVVVVDAESSGHIVGQLTTPATIRSLAQFGMIREQTTWMIEMLEDPQRTSAIVVTTPEESPVDETIDLVAALTERAHVAVAAVVVNSMPLSVPQTEANPIPLVTAVVERRHTRAFEQVRRLATAVPEVDIISLAHFAESPTIDMATMVAAALESELGEDL